jgi:hypothetical protein
MARGHGTYDDIILLNEVPDYEARVDKALHEGLKGCVHAHAYLSLWFVELMLLNGWNYSNAGRPRIVVAASTEILFEISSLAVKAHCAWMQRHIVRRFLVIGAELRDVERLIIIRRHHILSLLDRFT